jgi:hypothetical protein
MRLFTILSLFFLTSFRPSSFEVLCKAITGNGITQLQLSNSQLGSKYKEEMAKKDALKAILYSGVNGCGRLNALLRDSESLSQFKKIEKSFFSKKGEWLKYTRQDPGNNAGQSIGQYIIVVDVPMLRRDLESKNIIKALNHGF